MLRFLARRLAQGALVLAGVATLVFALLHLIPGDPAATMLGETASMEDVRALRTTLGLDRSLSQQYVSFLAGVIRGDLGRSLRTGAPVTQQVWQRVPATVELALGAMAVAVMVALPLGVLAAIRHGTNIDRTAMGVALVGVSIPNFWLGPILAVLFAVELEWLPVSGRGTVAHLVLPSVSLGTALAAVLARMTRTTLLDELRQPYVSAAMARGASRSRAVVAHGLRNALVPVVTILGLQFGMVLTGTVITETVFAWPGVGRLLIQSIGFRDYPVVQGCVLFIALTYMLVNTLTDLAYGALDPRIRVR